MELTIHLHFGFARQTILNKLSAELLEYIESKVFVVHPMKYEDFYNDFIKYITQTYPSEKIYNLNNVYFRKNKYTKVIRLDETSWLDYFKYVFSKDIDAKKCEIDIIVQTLLYRKLFENIITSYLENEDRKIIDKSNDKDKQTENIARFTTEFDKIFSDSPKTCHPIVDDETVCKVKNDRNLISFETPSVEILNTKISDKQNDTNSVEIPHETKKNIGNFNVHIYEDISETVFDHVKRSNSLNENSLICDIPMTPSVPNLINESQMSVCIKEEPFRTRNGMNRTIQEFDPPYACKEHVTESSSEDEFKYRMEIHQTLFEMGLTDFNYNNKLILKHNYDISKIVEECFDYK